MGEGFCDWQSHQNLLVEWGEEILKERVLVSAATKNKYLG